MRGSLSQKLTVMHLLSSFFSQQQEGNLPPLTSTGLDQAAQSQTTTGLGPAAGGGDMGSFVLRDLGTIWDGEGTAGEHLVSLLEPERRPAFPSAPAFCAKYDCQVWHNMCVPRKRSQPLLVSAGARRSLVSETA